VQCEAGLGSVTGTRETPSKAGITVADIAAGMYAYSGILAALFRRERAGEGAAIEVSLFEAVAEWMGFPAYYAMYGDKEPPCSGASHSSIAPHGPFVCAEGEVVFLGIQNEREWKKFCEVVLERLELAENDRFAGNSDRLANRDGLDEEIDQAFGQLTAEEIIGKLEAAGVANARLRSVREFLDHPQLRARNRWRKVESSAGPLRALVPPGLPADTDPVMAPIPEVGEHTAAILSKLGYERETVAALRGHRRVERQDLRSFLYLRSTRSGKYVLGCRLSNSRPEESQDPLPG
jgi:itaconate CoA-transferase